MLKEEKIASKVIVGFIIALVVAITIGAIGRQSLSKSTACTVGLAFAKMSSNFAVQEMVTGQLQVASGQRGLTIRRMSEPRARQVNSGEVDGGMRHLVEGRRIYERLSPPIEEACLMTSLVMVLLLGIGFVFVTAIMDKVVRVAATNAEESLSAAEELSSQSEEHTILVTRVQLERGGTKRVAERDVVAVEPRRRTTGPSVQPRRSFAPRPRRPRAPNTANTARKATAEEAIPFNYPELRYF